MILKDLDDRDEFILLLVGESGGTERKDRIEARRSDSDLWLLPDGGGRSSFVFGVVRLEQMFNKGENGGRGGFHDDWRSARSWRAGCFDLVVGLK